MKRKDIKAGERYVTESGAIYEVVSNEAGAVIVDGEFAVDHKMKKRYMGPAKGYKDYATNTAIPAVSVISGKRRDKVAIEPRDLVCSLAEWKTKESKLATQRQAMDAERKG